jgi:hypothetical protein
MGRYVGLSINKGGGGSGRPPNEEFSRATGITTDASNNVTSVTLGDISYTNVGYSTVGLITGFTESIGGADKVYQLSYNSDNYVTNITEV